MLFHPRGYPIYSSPIDLTFDEWVIYQSAFNTGFSGIQLKQAVKPGAPAFLSKVDLGSKIAQAGLCQGYATLNQMKLNSLFNREKRR